MENITQTVYEQTIVWGPRAGVAVAAFLIFWVLSKISYKAIIKTSTQARLNVHIASLLARSAKIALFVFGVVTALGTLGINVSALVAGLGLTGFALAFALKDTVSNLVAGVLILIYHPFEIKDRIKISGYEGVVVSVDLRYTLLESEGEKVLIPNSKLFTDPITILK